MAYPLNLVAARRSHFDNNFVYTLAVMLPLLAAGMPLGRAVARLAEVEEDRFIARELALVVREAVVMGASPYEALVHSAERVPSRDYRETRGSKVLYDHHKAYPTFVKFAEALGVEWRHQGVTWFYHSILEHKGVECWYRVARLVDEGGFDVYILDQYEAVAAAADEDVVRGLEIYQEALRRPVVTALAVNSYHIWRQVSRRIGPLVDYMFIFKPNSLRVYTPESAGPLEFQYFVDWAGRRVVFKKSS